MFRQYVGIMFFIIGALNTFGQTQKIEAIKQSIKLAKSGEQQLQLYFLLCEQRHSLSTDSLCKFATTAKNLSGKYNSIHNKALADYYLANCYVKKGMLDTALSICVAHLSQLKEVKPELSPLLKLTALKAQVLIKSNKYKEGLAECYRVLSLAEQANDTLMQMIAKNGIGWVHMEMAQNNEALSWFYKALRTTTNQALLKRNGNIYSNIAAVYIDLGNLDSATTYINKAIEYSRKDENLFFLSNSLNILANIFIAKKQAQRAEAPLEEALNLRKQIGDPYYIVSDMSQLAIFYANHGQPKKGIEISLNGIRIANQYNLFSKLPYLQTALAQNYKASGDYIRYGDALEKVIALKDSVYKLNSESALADISLKYEKQKQENIIIQQKLDINQKNAVLSITFISVVFAVVILALLFYYYKKKQKLIVENIKQQENQKAMEAIMIAEEKERQRISADLHDNLGAYASAISSNVDDLVSTNGNIDFTVLENIKSNSDDIMLSLRETIWALNKNEIRITSVSDRFKNYVSRLRDAYPNQSINVTENIVKDVFLSPEHALNMLRIMQEAFHNAVKHSIGNRISINIASDTNITVSIIDNGQGILNNSSEGNGLINMQKRAKANGWNLYFKTLETKGTSIELTS